MAVVRGLNSQSWMRWFLHLRLFDFYTLTNPGKDAFFAVRARRASPECMHRTERRGALRILVMSTRFIRMTQVSVSVTSPKEVRSYLKDLFKVAGCKFFQPRDILAEAPYCAAPESWDLGVSKCIVSQ